MGSVSNLPTLNPVSKLPPSSPWTPSTLRSRFVSALSDMYRTEVPLYGNLVAIVGEVDAKVLAARGEEPSSLPVRNSVERHGAIRLGTACEMRLILRLFALLGMHPVGYYDLSVVGFPLHGTAFRPVSEDELRKNPFRVFTTVLRPGLIASTTVRKLAENILAERQLFSPALCSLLDKADNPEGVLSLTASDADTLIAESLKIFKWHSRSTVPLRTYRRLMREHPMVADVVCFPSAHINHLTPRTLDIDAVQAEMVNQGLPAKESIEGPPAGRKCEILLRQTSFKALEEKVAFVGGDDAGEYSSGTESNGGTTRKTVDGTHTARFGEVEQRGAAVTRKGRELYDQLLAEATAQLERWKQEGKKKELNEALATTFRAYPDDWDQLRTQGLVYFRYKVAKESASKSGAVQEGLAAGQLVDMEALLRAGAVVCEPITYEDFLPLSAAGIFTSNLSLGGPNEATERKLEKMEEQSNASRAELEQLLGCVIPSEIDLYDELQAASVKACEEALGLSKIVLAA
ncbi:uncharacterized protein CcaverHIS019_0400140 [Cutaneotrichosporon cavernicola]|uniref:2-oxoadipate dioxygenase/decarboxylase n=1 Tax=Cutaneotrichosporon cavernicola TaxID=279322 RepID=A0AA48L3B9_9TREE|nr:uncharacterized protein CcaverHIS019_0400140 [Cutaneotrichosporon cavernicola]BEI91194.1 hypothetical protein CcaverHIS019_0400140 [Cutaneotrichosporon cavernicola]BEI98967.1 hypothetical protein CcaverHIS631_0400100 [Cutaneotrichosporon cavernicola]BEJ06741.1 hypothetical protein CcaverHIS641_0400100 [Cutaneotrichosporon cavernicola]